MTCHAGNTIIYYKDINIFFGTTRFLYNIILNYICASLSHFLDLFRRLYSCLITTAQFLPKAYVTSSRTKTVLFISVEDLLEMGWVNVRNLLPNQECNNLKVISFFEGKKFTYNMVL